MSDSRLRELTALLLSQGASTAAQIGAALGISQSTVSRLLLSAGDSVVRLGKARVT